MTLSHNPEKDWVVGVGTSLLTRHRSRPAPPDFAGFSLNRAGCPGLIVCSAEPGEAADGEVDTHQSNGDII